MTENTSTPSGDRVDYYKKYLISGDMPELKSSVWEPEIDFNRYVKDGDAVSSSLSGKMDLWVMRDSNVIEMIIGTLPKKDLNNLKEANKKKEIASIEAHDKDLEDKQKEDVEGRG